MPTEDKGDIVAIFVFAVILAMSAYMIGASNGFSRLLQLTLLDFIIIALATFRFTHLLTFDKVLGFARHWFMDGHAGDYVPPQRGVKKFIYGFIECLWCTGIWSALLVVTLYFSGVWGMFIVIIFAAAGIGSFLQVISRAIARE